jgi:hypothetical protein
VNSLRDMGELKTYGFIDESSIDISKFSVKITPILEKIIDRPDVCIIFSDISSGGVYINRFLKGHYYRNAVIYHVGDKPRINLSNLLTKGGFSDAENVKEAIIRDSDVLIRM